MGSDPPTGAIGATRSSPPPAYLDAFSRGRGNRAWATPATAPKAARTPATAPHRQPRRGRPQRREHRQPPLHRRRDGGIGRVSCTFGAGGPSGGSGAPYTHLFRVENWKPRRGTHGYAFRRRTSAAGRGPSGRCRGRRRRWPGRPERAESTAVMALPIRPLRRRMAPVLPLRSSPAGSGPMARQPARAQRGAAKWTAPRTPWGDPDLQGIYTNKDENNTPFERPAELAGKRLSDFGEKEMAALRRQRQDAAARQARSIGGTAEERHRRGAAALVRTPRRGERAAVAGDRPRGRTGVRR